MHIVIEKRIVLGVVLSILAGVALIVSIVKYTEGGLTPCDLIFYGIARSAEKIFLGTDEVYITMFDVFPKDFRSNAPQERYNMITTAEEFQRYNFGSSLKNKTSITLYKNCVGPLGGGYRLENFYTSSKGLRQALLVYIVIIFLFFVMLTGLCILDRKIQEHRNKIEINVIDPIDSVTL